MAEPVTMLAGDDARTRTSPDDDVVLLDSFGKPAGRARKRDVHGPETPLHLAFSCYVVDTSGRVLLTRRSGSKRTWPGVWTNACCGHPRPDEPIEHAVRRHLADEIGLAPRRLTIALPDFAYRAVMEDGTVEHELCPVYVAEVDADPVLDPNEADAHRWLTWGELRERAERTDPELSPWSLLQIPRLQAAIGDPSAWIRDLEDATVRPDRSPAAAPRRDRDPFEMARAVERVIDDFVADARSHLADMDPMACELSDAISALIGAGGKRLRPALVAAGHMAAAPAGDVNPDLALLGAAIEMLHTFALVHDDVMDRSPARRGIPTAHARFGRIRRDERGSSGAPTEDDTGDDAWFGASAAIVAGDLAFVWADQLLGRLSVDACTAERVRRVYDRLRTEVIAGQYLDLRLAGGAASDHQAQLVALLKSGRYTVTRPLELGATLGGADDVTLAALRRFGDAAGVGFQLRDDVLGVFGDPDVTGKDASEDMRSGKASLLLVRAIQLAAPDDRVLLQSSLGDPTIDDHTVAACRDAVRRSGALASVEALIEAKVDEAERALDDVGSAAAEHLSAIASLLTRRAA